MTTSMVEFVINDVRFKTKTQLKKFENINVNKNQELSEYIDYLNGGMLASYDSISQRTREVLKENVNDAQRAYLEWSLAHIHTDMLKLHESLKNMQKALRDNH